MRLLIFLPVFLLIPAAGALSATPPAPPPPRPFVCVPNEWIALTPVWKPTWDETLKANDMNAWSAELQKDKALVQAHGHIVWLRRVELLKAMVRQFPNDKDKHIQAYREMAQACRNVGDQSHANYYYQELIRAFPDRKDLAAEAYLQILAGTPYYQPDQIPDGQAWLDYAVYGIQSLRDAGAIGDKDPAVNLLWQNRYNVLQYDRLYEECRRFLDRYEARQEIDPWWRFQRASLYQTVGHNMQAADIYEKNENPSAAFSLRAAAMNALVQDLPRSTEVETRWEAMRGGAGLTGRQALADPAGIQTILELCGDTGAFQHAKEPPYLPFRVVVDRSLSALESELLLPLREAQERGAQGMAGEAARAGGFAEAVHLFRRYPWAHAVHEALVELGEKALTEGRGHWAAGAFQDVLDHTDDPHLRLQAHVGLWLCLAGEPDGRADLPRAMAAVPDGTELPWRGGAQRAADIKSAILGMASAPRQESRALAALPRRRIELPADRAWAASHADTPYLQAATLGAWPIQFMQDVGGSLFVSGPGLAACYDAAAAPRWRRASRQTDAVPGQPRRYPSQAGPSWAQAARRTVLVRGPASPSVGDRGPAGADGTAPRSCFFALVEDGPPGGARQAVVAFDAKTGDVLWSTAHRAEWKDLRPLSAPAAAEDNVYLLAVAPPVPPSQSVSVFLVCLDSRDGGMLWQRALGAQQQLNPRLLELAQAGSAVSLHAGALYCSTNLGVVARCDVRDGAVEWIWAYPCIDQGGRPQVQFRRQGPSPRVVDNKLIVAPRDHTGVMAIDCDSGKLLWEAILVPSDDVLGAVGNTLVVRGYREVAGLDIASGRETWVRAIEEGAGLQAALSGPDVIVVAGGALYRISAANGAVVEKLALDRKGGQEYVILPDATLVEVAEARSSSSASPDASGAPGAPGLRLPLVETWTFPAARPTLVVPEPGDPQETFCVLSGRKITCVKRRPTPTIAWQQTLPTPDDASASGLAAAYAGASILLSDGGDLTALDLATGAVRWSVRLNFPVDVFEGDGRIAFAVQCSRESNVAVVDAATGKLLWRNSFNEPPRFGGQQIRWARLRREDAATPTISLYWNAALLGDSGWRPAEAVVDARSGAVTAFRQLLPEQQPNWPRELNFDRQGMSYIDNRNRPHFIPYGGADQTADWKRAIDWSPIGRFPGSAGLAAPGPWSCIKVLGELFAFDPASKRETVYEVPRNLLTGRVCTVYNARAIGGQMFVVSGVRGRAQEYPLHQTAMFVDVFDRASGAHAGSQQLPDIPCNEYTRTGYDTQVDLVDDAVLVTTMSGVHMFQASVVGAAAPRELVLHRADAPIAIDGDFADWETHAAWPLTGEAGAAGTVRVTHDGGNLLISISCPDRYPVPFRGGAFGGGDYMELRVLGGRPERRWLIGIDPAGKAVVRDTDGEPVPDAQAACRFRYGAGRTEYEIALPLAELASVSEEDRHVRLLVRVHEDDPAGAPRVLAWRADAGGHPAADDDGRPVYLNPFTRQGEPAVREIAQAIGPPAESRMHTGRGASASAAAGQGKYLSQWVCITSGPRPTAVAVGLFDGMNWRYAAWQTPVAAPAQPVVPDWSQRAFLPWWVDVLPAQGNWVELRVPLAMLDMGDKPIEGLAFRQEGPGRVVWDTTAVIFPGGQRIILDDALPDGRAEGQWTWATDLKQSSQKAHEGPTLRKPEETATHSVLLAAPVADHAGPQVQRPILSQWVFLDRARPPVGVAMQLHDGHGWRDRFVWGDAGAGRQIGPRPPVGQWHELRIPLGLTRFGDVPIAGIAFDQADGRAFWGRTAILAGGKTHVVIQDKAPPARLGPKGLSWRPGAAELFVGGATPVEGKAGLAVRLDGRGACVVAPDSQALLLKNLTIEGWVFLDPPPGGESATQWIFSKNVESEGFLGYDLAVVEGRLRARVFPEKADQPLTVASGDPVLLPGAWHHVAMTWDGEAVAAYVDGKPIEAAPARRGGDPVPAKPGEPASAQPAPAGPRRMGPTPLFIGRPSAGGWPLLASPQDRGFRGRVDEVRLYARALSPAGIRTVCENPGPADASRPGLPWSLRRALVAAWNFDDAVLPADPAGEWQGVAQAGQAAHTLKEGAPSSVHLVVNLVEPITQHLPCDRVKALAALEKNLPALGPTEEAGRLFDLMLGLEGGTDAQRIARHQWFLKSLPARSRRGQVVDVIRQALPDAGGAFVRDWQIVGGYHNDPNSRNGFQMLQEPERKPIDLQARLAVWPPDAGPSRWRLLRSPSGLVDLRWQSSYNQSVCVIAACWAYTPRQRRVQIGVGCDDSIDVRVNRRLVHAVNSRPAAVPGDTGTEVVLQPGWNEIMLKVGQGKPPAYRFGFYFEMRDPVTGEPIEEIEFSPFPPKAQP